MTESLLLVAIKTDQPNIERRLRTILAASGPVTPDTEPVAWSKRVEKLVAADLDALASLVGWNAVSRLRVGGVAGGVSKPSPEAGPTATTLAPSADEPDHAGITDLAEADGWELRSKCVYENSAWRKA